MKTINYILFFTGLLLTSVFAQTKGVSPLSTANSQQSGVNKNTYAVVVGISDYQDPGIPDLRFADKDAEAFANFLRSNAGGKLDNDHLKVLLNKDATAAQFAIALDWLWEVVKEGDQVIIYFSGHGDVEKKSLTQPGYLLCWDAPSRVYLAGGALALPMFQDVISTLSVQNKAKVLVITDACRSGKLAGSTVGGSQITGANLAKQVANEIKILSCQANEYSIEGEQWGGGRGAFSYHLLDALYGFADHNEDQIISLQELGRYLEDHVSNEVKPVSQVPMTIGNRNEILSTVNNTILASLKSGKAIQVPTFGSIETRSIEEEVLSKSDTNTRNIYLRFKNALKQKILLEPLGSCAETYYQQLISEPKLERLYSTMKRNYAAALQDDAQGTLNKFLNVRLESTQKLGRQDRIPKKVFTNKVLSYPACLERAAELLGEQHYMYANLKARKYFFKGYLLTNSNPYPDKVLGEKALSLFRQSLKWQKDQPHVYWQMSLVFYNNLIQKDSMEHFAKLAISLYPNWVMPYTDLAICFLNEKFKLFDKANDYLNEAMAIDSSSASVWYTRGAYYATLKDYTLAEVSFKKAIELDSSDFNAHIGLGYLYSITRRYEDAEMILKKSMQIDSTNANSYGTLGRLYSMMKRYDQAEIQLKLSIQLDSTNSFKYSDLAYVYLYTNRVIEAENSLKKAIQFDSSYAGHIANLGIIYFNKQDYPASEQYLIKSIQLDSTLSIGNYYLGYLYMNTNRLKESESYFLKAIHFDSTNWSSLANLGVLYCSTKRWDESLLLLLKAIQYSPPQVALQALIGYAYAHLPDRMEDAKAALSKALEMNPNYPDTYIYLAHYALKMKQTDQAWLNLERGLEKGYKPGLLIDQDIENNSDFELMHKDEKWMALMQKYFPDKMK